MLYRELGKTGVQISLLGFGAMRLPMQTLNGKTTVNEVNALKMIHRAFELGVNYIDTAYGYCEGLSEIAVGKALKGWRDRVNLATKMPTWNVNEKGDCTKFLHEQLKKLDVDYIDFYHLHGLSRDRLEQKIYKFNVLEEMQAAKNQGLIKHISFSFHDKPEVMKEIIDIGIFESVLCQYNLLDRSNEQMIEYAKSKGLGTVIMGPVGGGRLGVSSEVMSSVNKEVKTTAELAIRFVMANQNADCVLSGMSDISMVEENAEIASRGRALSEAEVIRVNLAMEENKKLAELYCTGCNYCMPCPYEINIPYNFSLMNYHKVYGLTEYAREQYKHIGSNIWIPGKKAEECVECGVCESKCPQNIQIRKQLRETVKELAHI